MFVDMCGVGNFMGGFVDLVVVSEDGLKYLFVSGWSMLGSSR